jgi:hypothetical protein
MPTVYTPDLWAIIEVVHADGARHCRVFATWIGSYSWEFSSGIARLEEDPRGWRVYSESGSLYHCNRGAQGLSDYTAGVLAKHQEKMLKKGSEMKRLEGFAEVIRTAPQTPPLT